LLLWHVLARRTRPRRTDLSRRLALRTGAFAALAAGLYLATDAAVRLARPPGARRRFTRSSETGSSQPASMPDTLWPHGPPPVAGRDGLLLAAAGGDAPLSAGHGFTLRLVAPGRRGYWWVKWVDRISLSGAPWWWQPLFPLT